MLYISAIAPQWYNQSRVVCCAPKPATATARRALHSSPQLCAVAAGDHIFRLRCPSVKCPFPNELASVPSPWYSSPVPIPSLLIEKWQNSGQKLLIRHLTLTPFLLFPSETSPCPFVCGFPPVISRERSESRNLLPHSSAAISFQAATGGVQFDCASLRPPSSSASSLCENYQPTSLSLVGTAR